jgi:nitrite reductase/ring-hydroxylating ferredoxin subunit
MKTSTLRDAHPRQSAEDAGRYFRYMADFVGFNQDHVEAIQATRLIIEKHLPDIVSQFYAHLLGYPPMRKFFLKKDGTLDEEYLQLRMHHLTNFWRRTASGIYDDDYARYVDYVGRAHTSHGADPKIYIPERYVIGQVGFIQHAVSEAVQQELHDIDPDLEIRALKAWNLLMMVILELLSRAYSVEHEAEAQHLDTTVDHEAVFQLAVETYERDLGLYRSIEHKDMVVARAEDISDGERKIVHIDGLSIGVFHHKGNWYALRNSCLHRGGPIATGNLENDTLTCPWHGYQYNVTNGQFLLDSSVALDMYPVEVRDGEVHLQIPDIVLASAPMPGEQATGDTTQQPRLKGNEFRVSEVKPGQVKPVHLDGQPVAVYNVAGTFYATQDECTHAAGPLSEGDLDGNVITCPWHASCFDVTDGKVLCRPATQPLKTYRVVVTGEIGRVEKETNNTFHLRDAH